MKLKRLKPNISICFLTAVFLTAAPVVFSCRYNVRDMGFVDLGRAFYSLFLYIDKGMSADEDSMRNMLKTELANTNILFDVIDVDTQRNHSGLSYFSKQLRDSLPLLVLVSPEDSVFVFEKTGKIDLEQYTAGSMDTIFHTKMTHAIKKTVTENFGAVMVIKGEDEPANQYALNQAAEAVENIRGAMNSLPKSIANPPELVVLGKEGRQKERILTWALGLTDDEPAYPAVAVFYGRMRRMGPVLTGDDIDADKLTSMLTIVGADCECGLDRYWLEGKMLPHKWQRTVRDKLAKSLDFDPENPMVKIEMMNILGKGAGGRQNPHLSGLNLGYKEIEVRFDDKLNDKLEELNAEEEPAEQRQETTSENPARDESVMLSEEGESILYEPGRLFGLAALSVAAAAAVLLLRSGRAGK